MISLFTKTAATSSDDATQNASIAALEASQTAQDALIAALPTQAQVDALQTVQDAEDPYSAFVRQADGSIDWTRESGATGTIAAPPSDVGVLTDVGDAVEGGKPKLWSGDDIKTIGDTLTNGFFRSITTDYDHSIVATNDIIGLKNDNANGINVKLHDTGVDAVFSSILPGSVPSTQTGQTSFTLTPGACVALSRRSDGTVDVFYFGRTEISKMRGDNGALRVGQNLYFQDEAIGAAPDLPQAGLYSEYSVGVIQCDAADWDGTQAVKWTLYATVESGGTIAWAKSEAAAGAIDVDSELVWSATETDIPLGAVRTVPGTPVMLLGRIVDDATADGGGSPDGSKWQDITAQTADSITSVDSDVSAPNFFGVYREDDKEYVVTGATDINMLFPTAGPANDGWTATVYNNSTGTVTIGSTAIPASGGAHVVSSANQQVVSAWGSSNSIESDAVYGSYTFASSGESGFSWTDAEQKNVVGNITNNGAAGHVLSGGVYKVSYSAQKQGNSGAAHVTYYVDGASVTTHIGTTSNSGASFVDIVDASTASKAIRFVRAASSGQGNTQAQLVIEKIRDNISYVDKTELIEVEDAEVTLIDVDGTNGTTYPFSTGETWAEIKANYERLIVTGNASRSGVNQIRPWSCVIDLGDQADAFSQSGFRMDFTNDYSVTVYADAPQDTHTGLTYRQSGGDAPTSGRMQFTVVGVKKRRTVSLPDSVEVDITSIADGDTLVWDAVSTKFVKGTVSGGVNLRTFDFTTSDFINLAAETFSHGDVILFTNSGNRTGNFNASLNMTILQVLAINATGMGIGESITIMNRTGVPINTDDTEQISSALIVPDRSAVQLFSTGETTSEDFIPMRVTGNPNSV